LQSLQGVDYCSDEVLQSLVLLTQLTCLDIRTNLSSSFTLQDVVRQLSSSLRVLQLRGILGINVKTLENVVKCQSCEN
jgi:hypothetical protein